MNFFDFFLKSPALEIPNATAIFQKPGKQVLYMMPLLHPEDIDKDFVLRNQVVYCLSVTGSNLWYCHFNFSDYLPLTIKLDF